MYEEEDAGRPWAPEEPDPKLILAEAHFLQKAGHYAKAIDRYNKVGETCKL